jgi:hypothetical protein
VGGGGEVHDKFDLGCMEKCLTEEGGGGGGGGFLTVVLGEEARGEGDDVAQVLGGRRKGRGGKIRWGGHRCSFKVERCAWQRRNRGGGVQSGSVATRREKGPGPGQRAAPAWAWRSRAGGPVRPLK